MRRTFEELGNLYNALTPKGGIPCAYCGMYATDKEHVFPISWIFDLQGMKQQGMNVNVPPVLIVPACRECNLIASNKIFKSFRKKREYICTQLWRKHNKNLRKEEWNKEEIQEMSDLFQEQIFFYNEILKTKKQRLHNIKRFVDFSTFK